MYLILNRFILFLFNQFFLQVNMLQKLKTITKKESFRTQNVRQQPIDLTSNLRQQIRSRKYEKLRVSGKLNSFDLHHLTFFISLFFKLSSPGFALHSHHSLDITIRPLKKLSKQLNRMHKRPNLTITDYIQQLNEKFASLQKRNIINSRIFFTG